jgi:hypothetical protein
MPCLGIPRGKSIQPNSKEFFSNHDPLYRTYGKQAALTKQTELFAGDIAVEHDWLGYIARLKARRPLRQARRLSPLAIRKDHDNDAFHFTLVPALPRTTPNSTPAGGPNADHSPASPTPPTPSVIRASADIKTYLQKLFTEQAHALLRTGGRLGFILPSGLYSDKGNSELRILFLDHCSWEWCFGFENREGIFDIHRSFKFIALIVEKGGTTTAIRTAFMRRDVEAWDQHAEAIALDYPRELVTKLSPFSTALVEIRDPRDVAILDRMYSRGVLLGDQSERGWGLKFQQGDFNMTSDSKLFPPLPKWEAQGYRPDEYGHWVKGDWRPVTSFGSSFSILDPNAPPHERAATITTRPGLLLSRDGTQAIRIEDIEDVAVPLYEGRMIGQFDFSQKGWVSGKGRTAEWRDIPWSEKQIEPQYLMGAEKFFANAEFLLGPKAPFMPIGSATNQRTATSTYLRDLPAGHSVTYYKPERSEQPECAAISLTAYLNSFAYDFSLRQRLGGLNLSDFVMAETPLYNQLEAEPIRERLLSFAASLMLPDWSFSRDWAILHRLFGNKTPSPNAWGLSNAERIRLTVILDAIHARLAGLTLEDFSWLLRDCDHQESDARRDDFCSRLDPKGFWRVDKEKDPELRHTVLAQVAYADLCAQGLEAFLTGSDGDGWQLPETLRLADYGLGHDTRAQEPQPVAPRLGPRFLDWQLQKDPAQSWAECEAHARQLDALWSHARTLAGVETDSTESTTIVAEEPAIYVPKPGSKRKSDMDQLNLF